MNDAHYQHTLMATNSIFCDFRGLNSGADPHADTAYLLFISDKKPQILAQDPLIQSHVLNEMLSKAWKELDSSYKLLYYQRARKGIIDFNN